MMRNKNQTPYKSGNKKHKFGELQNVPKVVKRLYPFFSQPDEVKVVEKSAIKLIKCDGSSHNLVTVKARHSRSVEGDGSTKNRNLILNSRLSTNGSKCKINSTKNVPNSK